MEHQPKQYFVYILASLSKKLYIGVTNDLLRRLEEHRSAEHSFTDRYNITRLVYFEQTPYVNNALDREKQLKKWNRAWKLELIKADNPNWDDLSRTLY